METYKCKDCGPVEFENEEQKGLDNGYCYWCSKRMYIQEDKQLLDLIQTRNVLVEVIMSFAMNEDYRYTGEDIWSHEPNFKDYLNDLEEQWLRKRTL